MDCVIIGPSDRSVLWRHGKLSGEEYEGFVNGYGRFLSQRIRNVIVTPDDGVYTDVAQSFGRLAGRRPVAFYPDDDTQYGIAHIEPNLALYEARAIGGDWYTLDAEITRKAPLVICLGFAPGSMIELSFIQYHQRFAARKDSKLANITLAIDERTIEQRLPRSFHEKIAHIHYFSTEAELERIIGGIDTRGWD